MTEIHFLALDGGGTRCRAVIFDRGGTERARVTGGSANLTSDFDAAHRNIEEVITYAYRQAGMPEDARSSAIAVLGVADAETGDAAAQVNGVLPLADSAIRMSDGVMPSPSTSRSAAATSSSAFSTAVINAPWPPATR